MVSKYSLTMNSFAILDIETTGFGKSDRVVEIAIVLVDNGKITREWESLVNPLRDISNSNIHGITADLVSLAPTFEEIADEVAHLINHRIFVAHNIHFDSRILKQEFGRLERELDLGDGFCTLQATGMKLSAACEAFMVKNMLAHRALGDARATAEILMKVAGKGVKGKSAATGVEILEKPARTLSRDVTSAIPPSAKDAVKRIIPDFNETGYSGARLSYMDALSLVMNDFVITADEVELLRDWAETIGLGKEEQDEVHQDYLYLVLEAAYRDGRISETEATLIRKAAGALGVYEPVITVDRHVVNLEGLDPGIRVCFTGEARDSSGDGIPRESLEQLARSKGMVPVSSVTKKSCELLVAMDKSSMSGKAQKARGFNIDVMSVEEFLDWASA